MDIPGSCDRAVAIKQYRKGQGITREEAAHGAVGLSHADGNDCEWSAVEPRLQLSEACYFGAAGLVAKKWTRTTRPRTCASSCVEPSRLGSTNIEWAASSMATSVVLRAGFPLSAVLCAASVHSSRIATTGTSISQLRSVPLRDSNRQGILSVSSIIVAESSTIVRRTSLPFRHRISPELAGDFIGAIRVAIAPYAYSAASRPWPSRALSVSNSFSAASAITVPGGKIASAPARLSSS